MGKTTAVVLALVVGIAVGFYFGSRGKGGEGGGTPGTGPAKCLTPGNQLIDVTIQGTPSCPDATLSQGNQDGIVWQSPDGSTLMISAPTLPGSVNGSYNTQRFVIPPNYTPNNTPIVYGINVYPTGTPTPVMPQTPRPTPQANGRIIIMK